VRAREVGTKVTARHLACPCVASRVLADAIDEALERGEVVGVHGGYQVGNQPLHGAEVDRRRYAI